MLFTKFWHGVNFLTHFISLFLQSDTTGAINLQSTEEKTEAQEDMKQQNHTIYKRQS